MNIDWKAIFLPDIPLIEIVLRGSIMYLSLFILLRIILKRQSGTLGITDLLLITLLADASQNGMAGELQVSSQRHSAGRYYYFLGFCARLAEL